MYFVTHVLYCKLTKLVKLSKVITINISKLKLILGDFGLIGAKHV